MKEILLVGGSWNHRGRKSSIVTNLGKNLNAEVFNGGVSIQFMVIHAGLYRHPCCIWMPDVDNSAEKIYPWKYPWGKNKGSVLICSKVLRYDNQSEDEAIMGAINTIFKMHGNAVIALDKRGDRVRFLLIDALGNLWTDTKEIPALANAIQRFLKWNQSVVRMGSKTVPLPLGLEKLCSINRSVATQVANSQGQRYFGNSSTRCSHMFPSARGEGSILISKRNISKKTITPDDFVKCYLGGKGVMYEGVDKPSIDAPIQLTLYRRFPWINYMIHGHAYIKDAECTKNYCVCGDLREVKEILECTDDEVMNLKNHGFLIMASSIQELEKRVKNSIFELRPLCEPLH